MKMVKNSMNVFVKKKKRNRMKGNKPGLLPEAYTISTTCMQQKVLENSMLTSIKQFPNTYNLFPIYNVQYILNRMILGKLNSLKYIKRHGLSVSYEY